MIWFYRLQQYVAITRFEGIVLLVLALGFAGGLVAQTLQEQGRPLPADVYVEADRRFYAASREPARPVASEPQPVVPEAPVVVNLNEANSAELQQLPRIGPKTAARILDYRTRRGGFQRVEDLTRISGIGPKTLERLAPLVAVE